MKCAAINISISREEAGITTALIKFTYLRNGNGANTVLREPQHDRLQQTKQTNSMASVRERAMLVGDVSSNFCG
jgi:hypothetical protein